MNVEADGWHQCGGWIPNWGLSARGKVPTSQVINQAHVHQTKRRFNDLKRRQTAIDVRGRSTRSSNVLEGANVRRPSINTRRLVPDNWHSADSVLGPPAAFAYATYSLDDAVRRLIMVE
ncbi:hypothetical protein FRB93_001837 [Tulasnella sp. JGI-2019a]|nr:hypothetical protein FRB93_001837 [Tulasnella sp. JGI-2019a]